MKKKRLKLLVGADQSVEASIGVSYGLLDLEAQKRWRTLGVFPDTFDSAAAAAVWEIETDPAQDALSRLLQHSMLEWNKTSKRYRLHDLMRDFALARLDTAEREESSRRHAKYYLDLLRDADALYIKGGESLMAGLALFNLEWVNVRTGQAWAAAHLADDPEAANFCSSYPEAGAYCLGLRLHPREQIRWLEVALFAARQLNDRATEGAHLGNLGLAYKNLGEYPRAIGYQEQALAIAREMGIRRAEGQALGNLGNAYYLLGEHRRAIEYHEQALAIDREIGDRQGEGQDLGNLGVAYQSLGENRHAIEYYEQALAIDREIGDRRGEGQNLGNLGNAYHSLREYRRAIEYYEQALAIACEIGDRRSEATSLWNMSLALEKLGERKKAIENAEAALEILEQIESPYAETVRKQLEQWKQSRGARGA